MDLYAPLVFHWCRRYGLNSTDAADVLQEVFAAVGTSLPRFDPRIGTFRGWLWSISRNKIRDYYRGHADRIQATGGTDANQRLMEIPDEWSDDRADPEDRPEMESLFRRGLELVRAEFEDRTWEAFWRCVVEEHDTADIAADLGITPAAVRQHKSRVLRRLRQQLGDLPD